MTTTVARRCWGARPALGLGLLHRWGFAHATQRHIGRRALLCLLAATQCACAYSVTRPDGSRQIIGFVNLTIEPSVPDCLYAGQITDLKTIGGLISRSPAAGVQLAAGYSHERIGYLRNHALVFGDTSETLCVVPPVENTP